MPHTTKTLFLALVRSEFRARSTRGTLYANGVPWCVTLEDTVRYPGIKIPSATAIPDGVYSITVTKSERFGCMLPLVADVPGFSGVRLHGGNTHLDTDGCILVAKNKAPDLDGELRIVNSMSKSLVELIGQHDACLIHIMTKVSG